MSNRPLPQKSSEGSLIGPSIPIQGSVPRGGVSPGDPGELLPLPRLPGLIADSGGGGITGIPLPPSYNPLHDPLNFASSLPFLPPRPLLPHYAPPLDKRSESETVVAPYTKLHEIEELIPNWAEKWSSHASASMITVWIEPKDNKVPRDQVEEALLRLQDALYPVRVSLTLPPDVTSPEGRPLPQEYSFIYKGKLHEPEEEKAPPLVTPKKSNHTALSEVIERELASLARSVKTTFARMSLTDGTVDFAMISLWPRKGKDEELSRWRDDFERRHGVTVLLNRRESSLKFEAALAEIADSDGVIRPHKIHDLRLKMREFFPSPTSNKLLPERQGTARDDLTHVPFIAIDGEKTKDREDLVFAEVTRKGELRVLIAIIDVTDIVPRESQVYWDARRLGHTFYGRYRNLPTLGKKVAQTQASFLLNEVRPAWVVELRINRDTGDFIDPRRVTLTRAMVQAHTYMTPQDFARKFSLTPDTKHTRVTCLAEAAAHLRRMRLKKNKVVRMSGDGIGSDVVGELMIACAGHIGKFLHQHKAPAIWRVHSKVSEEGKRKLANEISDILKREITPDDFNFKEKFAPIYRELEAKGTRPASFLARRLFDYFLTKSRFSSVNEPHYGTGQDYYVPVKPRDSGGIRIQHQADAIFRHDRLIPLREIKKEAEYRDHLKSVEDEKSRIFNLFDLLDRKLSNRRRFFECTVTAVEGDRLILQVPSFRYSGIALLPHAGGSTGEASHYVGQNLIVALDGFDPKEMNFRFKVIRTPVVSGLEAFGIK